MNSYLKQSTASQDRAIGPFVDDTDFKTEETALTIANTDIKLIKNGATSVNKNSGGGTHRINGIYGVTFDATDTNTVGELKVSIKVTGALTVFHTFYVLEEAVYDILFSSSSTGEVPLQADAITAAKIADNAIGADQLAADAITSTQIADNAIAAAKIGANAITAAKIAASALDGKGDWLTTLGTNAPANWINAAAIATSALDGKGDWLTTLGTNAPAGWINAAAIVAAALNGKGDWPLNTDYTASRSTYLDNLNVGGNVASSSEVTNITNNTRAVITAPTPMVRPSSLSTDYKVRIALYDTEGNAEAPDSAPTIAAEDASGTSLNTNLDSTTMSLVSTGYYEATYSVQSTDDLGQVNFAISIIEGTDTRVYPTSASVTEVGAAGSGFNTTDRTKLDALHDNRITASRAGYLDNLNGHVAQSANNDTNLTTLTTRLSAVRAGYLDNLNGHVAQSADNDTNLTTLVGRLTAARAGYLDNLNGHTAQSVDHAAAIGVIDNLIDNITTQLAGITSLAEWLRAGLRSDTADTTALAEINSGGGDYTETTDSQEAIYDKPSAGGDATQAKQDTIIAGQATILSTGSTGPWTTGGGGGGGDATSANQATILGHLTDIKGSGWADPDDTLETIKDTISGAGGVAGPGADLCTMTITDDSLVPIPNAQVWISSDSSGSLVVAGTRVTDSNGEVPFMLDDGNNYYLWWEKDGYNGIQGELFTAVKD